MAECDHPAPDESRIMPREGRHPGEYIVQVGSALAEGPALGIKVDEAVELSREVTGATSRAIGTRNQQQCPKCGVRWSEVWVRPEEH